ncbi:hypothetical protein A2625_03190 [candidate division WOR-1 bacterium RIFCSPHIGHO2_01_FULL_53_15]|uniref:Response regulatory domain-containing protein n=1 Tax=candidate division WOR-1 bacterium RIFCSPHIGHO2_01_FULL_53_15 TaxID=1802564 RepID=A0A1F4Q3E5_UNCSA|nr:MAG: hypothetical protein A2625_03190 [candidate division WOR-1 bacterium RIFCSPHIGHO2_01_FULL_53_15]OGC12466.1 MAG: hypothetical protein A3D23_05610 [candidate division WOR-1 bacterium RIFCSPHIGHO2_02_FULL_53_26]
MAKKILIIEDYPATSKMIADILELEGFEAVIEPDGITGLKKAAEEKPDLILLDIMLPGMDGLEVCTALKTDPRTKTIPIIILSVKASNEEIKAGLDCGAEDYITKPFEPLQLIEAVKKYLI